MNVAPHMRNILDNSSASNHKEAQIKSDLPLLPQGLSQISRHFHQWVWMGVFLPFLVKINRSDVKRYGCMFTCLVVRSVHIGMLSDLDTESFINALSSFISRRGQPDKIVSNNATHSVEANDELRKAIRDFSNEDIEAYALKNNIEWHFVPPEASREG